MNKLLYEGVNILSLIVIIYNVYVNYIRILRIF